MSSLSLSHSGVGGFGAPLTNIADLITSRAWAKKPYVDAKRIGIWGWVSLTFLCLHGSSHFFPQSYGGFMSAKVAEANAKVHSLAMAVAVGVGPRNIYLGSILTRLCSAGR